ncbi:MAG: VOC family protein [Planctomycetota bacterium]|jgi:predicted enzyme related to lactoylglutathione lyase
MGNPVVSFDIGCRDRDRAVGFYRELFDWEDQEANPLSSKVQAHAAKGINGAITALGHEPENYVMIYVEVEDIPATLAKAESLGAQTMIPETEIPEGGWFAWFADLDGNLIGLYRTA